MLDFGHYLPGLSVGLILGAVVAWAACRWEIRVYKTSAQKWREECDRQVLLASDYYCKWERDRRHNKRDSRGRFARRWG